MVQEIAEIVKKVLQIPNEVNIHEISLFDVGLNSLNTIEIVVELENRFGIHVEDDDLIIENFENIERIKQLVNRYQAA